MVKFYPSISEEHVEFIKRQSIFFVSSAPLAGSHVNISPKGHPERSFAILDENRVAYLDAAGSGCETISHVYENGRVTVMFCSFNSSPKIMRLFCWGRIVEKDDKEYEGLRAKMGSNIELTGARAIILLDVWKVQTACGFGVPLVGQADSGTEGGVKCLEPGDMFIDRDTMDIWATKMLKKDKMLGWEKTWNFQSLDGLTGLRSARMARGQWMLLEDSNAWARRVGRQWDALLVGMLLAVSVMWALTQAGLLMGRQRLPVTSPSCSTI